MASIKINGISYQGDNIRINKNKVFVDDVNVTTKNTKEFFIYVDGNINELNSDVVNDIAIEGRVGKLTTTRGDVSVVGHVLGDVKTMSGDVIVAKVTGSIKTLSGNIKYKK